MWWQLQLEVPTLVLSQTVRRSVGEGGMRVGELGKGYGFAGNDFNTPQLVIDLETGVTAIATGNNHSCAVQNGAGKCWGRNNDVGQLGNSSTKK